MDFLSSGESWRLKRWGHQAAAGTALAELRQCFRYELRRCCYQGRSYEAASVWWTSNSYCVGWPPSLLPSADSESLPVFELFGFDGYRTNSPLKQVKVQSEVAYLNWHFGSARQKHGIYRPSIIMEMWTSRREWKLWEAGQLGIYSITLLNSSYRRSVWWRGMSTQLLGLLAVIIVIRLHA